MCDALPKRLLAHEGVAVASCLDCVDTRDHFPLVYVAAQLDRMGCLCDCPDDAHVVR